MGFGKGEYGNVFQVKKNDNGYIVGLFSSSYKDKAGEWQDDFFGEVTFYGDAAEKALALEGRTFVQLTRAKTTRKAKDGKYYIGFSVFDFEVVPSKEKPAEE